MTECGVVFVPKGQCGSRNNPLMRYKQDKNSLQQAKGASNHAVFV